MYHYQTDARSKDGQRWLEFESQLYLSALDDQHRARTSVYVAARQPDCLVASNLSSQSQLLGPQFSSGPHRAQQPSVRNWQTSGSLSSCLTTAAAMQHRSSPASAAWSTSKHSLDTAYQPPRSGMQYSAVGPQWQSPSSNRILAHHQHYGQEQCMRQECDMFTSASLAPAAGPQCSVYDHDEYCSELAQFGSHMQHSSSDDTPVSFATPFKGQPAFAKTEQCLEAAALSAVAWPNSCSSARSPPSGGKFPDSFSSQNSGSSDLCPEDLPEVLTVLPAPLPAGSNLELNSPCNETDSATDQQTKTSGRKKTKIDHITVEYLRDHHCFDMPLAEAAKSLDVGLSVMKRVCRTLGLARWPYRTRSSLRSVIEKTEKYLADQKLDNEEGEASSGQKTHVLEALQSQMNSVTGREGSDLNASIKKYRQTIFKLNYKLKKSKMNCKARHRIAVPQNAAERVLANKPSDQGMS